jgi:hypothetical protein
MVPACQEAREACLEKVDGETAANRKEMKACLEEAVACLKRKPNPKNVESVAEQQEVPEVPKEEAAVKAVRALKGRYGERHLAVERRRQQ